MFVHAHRSTTIRTRLSLEEILARVTPIAETSAPTGLKEFLSHGYFMGGGVGARDFHLAYHHNVRKNPQTYDIQGAIEETPDWRIVQLRFRSRDPWLQPLVIALPCVILGVLVAIEGLEMLPKAAAAVGFVMAVYAVANLLYLPDVAANRVTQVIASELNGSIRQGQAWVVPTK